MPTKQKRATSPQFQINDDLPTLHIDGVDIRRRDDDVYLVRFTANLPEALSEQARLMINEGDLRLIIDAICEAANYYPVKPEESPQPVPK